MLIRTIVFLLLTSAAFAQQTTAEQALSQKLLEEMNSNIQLRIQLIQAQAKIKELESKQEQTTNGKEK